MSRRTLESQYYKGVVIGILLQNFFLIIFFVISLTEDGRPFGLGGMGLIISLFTLIAIIELFTKVLRRKT